MKRSKLPAKATGKRFAARKPKQATQPCAECVRLKGESEARRESLVSFIEMERDARHDLYAAQAAIELLSPAVHRLSEQYAFIFRLYMHAVEGQIELIKRLNAIERTSFMLGAPAWVRAEDLQKAIGVDVLKEWWESRKNQQYSTPTTENS